MLCFQRSSLRSLILVRSYNATLIVNNTDTLRLLANEGIGRNLVGLHQMDLVLTMDYILTRSICCCESIMATRPIW